MEAVPEYSLASMTVADQHLRKFIKQKEAEEQNRLDWENSIPMGGNPKDVFGLRLMLSVGNISSNDFIEERQNYKIFVDHLSPRSII